MRLHRIAWSERSGWSGPEPSQASLVLYFGSRHVLGKGGWLDALRARYPDAHLLGCSSGSQIRGGQVVDDGITAVAMDFGHTPVRAVSFQISRHEESLDIGRQLGRKLAADDLAGVLVLSDGLSVNGSELTKGIASQIRDGVPISGGLAGDGASFEKTLVGLDEAPQSGQVAAVGFYGKAIRLTTGSAGGWAEFGPRREITGSRGNVLHSLDGEPALDLYERYLGEDEARALPSSALLFPLKVFDPNRPEHSLVRTVLAVDRQNRTMTFAGDVPQGWVAQLMRGTIDRLALGAAEAARQVHVKQEHPDEDTLLLMISCIGRQLLMGQRVIDEVDAVTSELGAQPMQLGFYSYGEICPHEVTGLGEMQNQTMTIMAISEAA